jgi:hypothetical protein
MYRSNRSKVQESPDDSDKILKRKFSKQTRLCKNVTTLEQRGKPKSTRFSRPPNDKNVGINSDLTCTSSPTTSSHADPIGNEYKKHLATWI